MLGFLKKKIKESISKAKEKELDKPVEEIKEEIQEESKAEKKEVKKERKPLFKKKPKEKVEKVKEEKPIPEAPSEKKPKEKKRGGLKEEDIEDFVWDLQIALLESDVATETAEYISSKVKEDLLGESVKKKDLESTVKDSLREVLTEIMDQEEIDLVKRIKSSDKPFKIIFIGFNGAGKTTTVARVAHILEKKGLTSVMAAADTWRAAAIQQLEKHGANLGVKVISHDYGSDAAAVIFDAVKHAESKKLDVVLADTAGRSHTNSNLMQELEKVCRVNDPDMKILVVDSLTGNDAVEQALAFKEKIGIDAIILTKMDVNEKGGAAISVSHVTGSPILYIGTGQEYGDLKPFKAEDIVKAILD